MPLRTTERARGSKQTQLPLPTEGSSKSIIYHCVFYCIILCGQNSRNEAFVLRGRGVRKVNCAVVVVKPWHTEIFISGVVASSAEIEWFVHEVDDAVVRKAFGIKAPVLCLLTVSGLPRSAGITRREYQEASGIRNQWCPDLRYLIDSVRVNRNYQTLELLQTLRILKNY
ncbi:MAG: hypothetical protein M2R45_02814 [Verrucomicrobia subdivision 3 bacterium]|nr:hypothetical protein [Limisphaerales bacterium]MCS1414366.1 hypothetical protein [Limisphaerales bacterium]